MLVLFVISVAVLSDAGLSVEVFRAGVAPRCESRACNPRMGNLALGRRVLTQTVCGNNGTELYCSYSDPNTNLACSAAKCAKCNAGLPLLSHLAGGMSDSSFRHPNTWWQSAEGVESETVQLDLEAEFYFTHLIVVFRSPRPAAMTLERSQDFGRTWKMLQYYASNCSAAFGLEEGKAGGGQDGASCTSKYSAAYPCNRGEWESLDPFGEEGQQQLRVTNVRIRLLKHQPCPCQAKDLASAHEALPTQHFAIYDLIVKGSCFCNGHAEQCVPAPGYQPIRDRTNHVIFRLVGRRSHPNKDLMSSSHYMNEPPHINLDNRQTDGIAEGKNKYGLNIRCCQSVTEQSEARQKLQEISVQFPENKGLTAQKSEKKTSSSLSTTTTTTTSRLEDALEPTPRDRD
ncbi:Netrin-4 Beta-netrin Hepar-derived netrin-like protein [Collichthys lucidus]|uniref:Netrin-4 Beta-netrin Hepar-derived netrin-like protein n=1 Tax=Collichthys lucidus TaxID=240159 RepID=A0A4U5VPW0_COLLU|nr:Netrin-4 Beta-netrin Hepar-derived netrin-like protein [Collichthys lucidus]